MQIECTTTSAASQVVQILMDAQLWPGKAFYLDGPAIPDPPIIFTLRVDLPPQLMLQVQDIATRSIEPERSA